MGRSARSRSRAFSAFSALLFALALLMGLGWSADDDAAAGVDGQSTLLNVMADFDSLDSGDAFASVAAAFLCTLEPALQPTSVARHFPGRSLTPAFSSGTDPHAAGADAQTVVSRVRNHLRSVDPADAFAPVGVSLLRVLRFVFIDEAAVAGHPDDQVVEVIDEAGVGQSQALNPPPPIL
jgi:hypothetical protein